MYPRPHTCKNILPTSELQPQPPILHFDLHNYRSKQTCRRGPGDKMFQVKMIQFWIIPLITCLSRNKFGLRVLGGAREKESPRNGLNFKKYNWLKRHSGFSIHHKWTTLARVFLMLLSAFKNFKSLIKKLREQIKVAYLWKGITAQ